MKRKFNQVNDLNNENDSNLQNVESSREDQVNFDELLIQNGLRYYPKNLHSTIHYLCKKYGSSRYNEIFQLSNTIGNENNSLMYLQVVGMPGTGKYSIVKDFLKKNNSIFGFINGIYSKWLSNSKSGTLHKLSVDNIFVRPIEQIRKKMIKRGILKSKNKKLKSNLILNELDDSINEVNNLIEFINELRLIKKEYIQALINEKQNVDDSEEIKSKCIFLLVKDVTTISKNRPDLLLTLLKLHEHLRDIQLFPIEQKIQIYINFCVIFIDNNGIPEDLFCNHNPIPTIWFSAYNDLQCFNILVNLCINKNINYIDINNSFTLENNKNSIMFDSLKYSYRCEIIEFIKKNDEYLGIKLLGINNDNFENFISTKFLLSIWTEFIAEMITVLYSYLKSDFQELFFKIKHLWPVFLLPIISGEINIIKQKLIENYDNYIHELIQSLIKRFKRHYNSIIKNLYSHHIPDLFQGDLISTTNVSKRILNYGFLKNNSYIEMPYFSKLLLISAYVASKVSKKNDNKLFYNLVSSKLKSTKSKKKICQLKHIKDEKKEQESFSLIRWLAITDCIAYHITGSQGIDHSITILEQINDIIKLGFVIPIGIKNNKLIHGKNDIQNPLSIISPISDLNIGQNIGIEMIMYKQNRSFKNNNQNYNYNSKLTNIDSLINIEDPRTLYILQTPLSIIETFSMDVGIVLKEIIFD